MRRIGLLLGVVALSLSACNAETRPDPDAEATLASPAAGATAALATPVPIATPPFPHKPIQLAWFYKPPEDGNLDPLAGGFDFIILSRGDEDEVDGLRARGVSAPILQYFALDAIQDPGTCADQPLRNQVAFLPGDFCTIDEQHPDWFLLDGAGRRIERNGRLLMDPGNAEWRAFFLQRVIEAQAEAAWSGVFLDNVEASLAKRESRGAIPGPYPDDRSYRHAIAGFLRHLAEALSPQQRLLAGNIIAVRDDAGWFEYLPYLDAAMEESFALDWDNRTFDAGDWEAQMARLEASQARGKRLVLVAQGTYGDLARQQFALASFLLINDGWAYFRYSNADNYRETWLYENYGWELGTPLGPRYRDGDVWRRDFSRGMVSANPAAHTSEIVRPEP